MKTLPLLAIIQTASDARADEEVLTIAEMVADIPHDAAAIFIYILLVVSVGVVIRTGRQKKKSSDV